MTKRDHTKRTCEACHWIGGVPGKELCVKGDALLPELEGCPGFERDRPDWPRLVLEMRVGLDAVGPGDTQLTMLETFDHEALETSGASTVLETEVLETVTLETEVLETIPDDRVLETAPLETSLLETPHLTNAKPNELGDPLETTPTSLNIQGWTIRQNRRGYWMGYRRIQGKLKSIHIGKTLDGAEEKLKAMSQAQGTDDHV